MKFYSYLFIGIGILLYTSCQRYTQHDLTGTWILCHSDGNDKDLDSATIIEYHSDGSLSLSRPYLNGKSFKSKWIESTGTYRVNGDKIIEEGRNALSIPYRIVKKITMLNDSTYTSVMQQYITGDINQMAFQKPYTEFFRKVVKNENILLGCWEIISPVTGFRFDYFQDHLYDFYELKNGIWQLKTDNNGTWYIYGNLLCHNFFNGVIINEEGLLSECSYGHIEKKDSLLYWKANTNGMRIDYVLKRVAGE